LDDTNTTCLWNRAGSKFEKAAFSLHPMNGYDVLRDLNGDGFIDPDEFHALLEALDGDVSRAECQLDFEAADTAGDGYIEFREFVAWWTN
jgi:hypothetical protein